MAKIVSELRRNQPLGLELEDENENETPSSPLVNAFGLALIVLLLAAAAILTLATLRA